MVWFLLVTLMLAACASAEPEEIAQVPPAASVAALPTAEAAITAVPEPTITNAPHMAEPILATEPAAVTATEAPPTISPPPLPSATAVPVENSGQTEEGAFFLGDAAAPVTIIDYSDFL